MPCDSSQLERLQDAHVFHRATVQLADEYRCARCDGVFQTRRIFNLHMRCVHEHRRAHHCPHCRLSFGHLVDLNEHIRQMHSARDHNALFDSPCPFCGVRFATSVHLKFHIRDDHAHRLHPDAEPPRPHLDEGAPAEPPREDVAEGVQAASSASSPTPCDSDAPQSSPAPPTPPPSTPPPPTPPPPTPPPPNPPPPNPPDGS